MSRYAELLGLQLRLSLLLAMQYRLDFVLRFGLGLFWSASALVPLLVLFSVREGVAGWTWPEALLVISFFLLLKGVLEAAIHPATIQAVESIRLGTLDFVLLKPADAQFLITTSRFDLARGSDALAGAVLLGFALVRRGEPVSPGAVALAAWLLTCGLVILYSIFVLCLSFAFRFVKIDNLSYLMTSIFDAARWPVSIFRGLLALLFTFLIPLAVMTTYPSMALLGRATASRVLVSTLLAAVFLTASRVAWRRGIRHYTSAGG